MSTRKKDVQLKAWVSPEQKRHWQRAADAAKRSLSDWLRIVADEAATAAVGPTDDARGKRGGSDLSEGIAFHDS